MYSGISGTYPACSTSVLLGVRITHAVHTNHARFGGDKQLQTAPSELARVAHHQL